jgi:ankyrin repeat protein
VFCQLETLRRGVRTDVRGVLEKLPKTLDETYERVLKTIHDNNRKYARRLLHCLAVSVRPLRVEELAEILTFEFDTVEGGIPKFHPNWRPNNREGAILATCSSLIAIVDIGDSRVVQFSHRTVRDFLTSRYLASSAGSLSYHILPGRAHTILVQVCLGLLLNLDGRNCDSNIKGSPLAEYAARHWVEHAQFENVASRVADGMKSLFDPDKPHFATWIGLYDLDSESSGRTPPEIPSPLYYSALCGFHSLARYIATKNPQLVNAIGGSYGFALVAALCKNHFLVAEILLELGGRIDVLDARKQTALHRTIDREDNAEIGAVRFLLDHSEDLDADVNARRDDLWTPLHLAVNIGDLSLSRMLLTCGADVNSRNSDGQAPLHLLARRETFLDEEDGSDIAVLLLEHGGDVNLEDKDNATPLSLASDNKKFKLVQVLLDPVEKDQRETPIQTVLRSNFGDANNEKHHHSKSSTPRSRSSSPTPPPTSGHGPLRSFGVCELSPVGDATASATKLTISTRAASHRQSVTGTRTSLPVDSPDGLPTTSAVARVPPTTLLSCPPATFPEPIGGHKLDGDGTLTPASTWWTNSKRKRTVPIEQAEGFTRTRSVRLLLSTSFTDTHTL